MKTKNMRVIKTVSALSTAAFLVCGTLGDCPPCGNVGGAKREFVDAQCGFCMCVSNKWELWAKPGASNCSGKEYSDQVAWDLKCGCFPARIIVWGGCEAVNVSSKPIAGTFVNKVCVGTLGSSRVEGDMTWWTYGECTQPPGEWQHRRCGPNLSLIAVSLALWTRESNG